MSGRRRRIVIWLLLPVLGYAAICLLLVLQQERLVFPGAGRGDRGGLPGDAVVSWLGDGDRRTRMVTVAAPQPSAVLLYFVGNGEDLLAAAHGAEVLAQYGVEVLGVEYPGYGASAGRPSADSLMATADAAAAVARARAAALRLPLVVVGSSLGSFCATHVAAAGGVDKLVLRAPPTTLSAVASWHYRWLPVQLLLRHRFDNLAPAANIACPVLVLHGEDDSVVPVQFGREVAAALPRARLVVIPGRGHNDLDLSPAGPAGPALRDFLGRS